MAKIGRPPGAVNLDKPYKEALRCAVARAQADNKPHTLDKIAEQHLITAALGDMSAIKELADRLDGKSMQETSLNVSDKREAIDWTRGELLSIAYEQTAGGGDVDTEGRRGKKPN